MNYRAPTDAEVQRARGPRPGVAAVRDAVLLVERGRLRDLGIYNRRRVSGSRSWSSHAAGRGWDVGHKYDDGPILADAFARASRELGIVQVISRRRIWEPGRGWNHYTGPSHNDHVHLSFDPDFADSPAPPDVARYLCALVWGRYRPSSWK